MDSIGVLAHVVFEKKYIIGFSPCKQHQPAGKIIFSSTACGQVLGVKVAAADFNEPFFCCPFFPILFEDEDDNDTAVC